MAHGASLMTHDVDVCLDFDVENLKRLLAAIGDLEPVHRMTPKRTPLASSAADLTGFKNLYLDTRFGQLDCVSLVDGLGGYPTFALARSRSSSRPAAVAC